MPELSWSKTLHMSDEIKKIEQEKKSQITEEIRKIIERDDKFIETSFENLKFAVDNCLPAAAAIAVRISRDVASQERISETFLALGDQPEEANEKVIARTSMQRDKLTGIIDQFVKGCKCGKA